jgi:hypothetical protein
MAALNQTITPGIPEGRFGGTPYRNKYSEKEKIKVLPLPKMHNTMLRWPGSQLNLNTD